MPATAYKEEIDPRRWFVERIRTQAKEEGVEFTQLEQEYLCLTENGSDESALRLLDQIKGKGWDKFDRRIGDLAWTRYQADLRSEPEAKEQYDKALKALADVDRCPNLSMFIACIPLETPPEKLEPKALPRWVTCAVIFAVLAFIIFVFSRK